MRVTTFISKDVRLTDTLDPQEGHSKFISILIGGARPIANGTGYKECRVTLQDRLGTHTRFEGNRDEIKPLLDALYWIAMEFQMVPDLREEAKNLIELWDLAGYATDSEGRPPITDPIILSVLLGTVRSMLRICGCPPETFDTVKFWPEPGTMLNECLGQMYTSGAPLEEVIARYDYDLNKEFGA